jgi:hypothetical protein
MKPMHPALVLFLAAVPSLSLAAGLARNENFIVFAPDGTLAHEVLRHADAFRREIAREWLDTELPQGAGRTVINVKVSQTEDRAFTWPRNGTDRRFHWTWLTTSRQRALGSTLRHEMTHIVLATHCPGLLPAWVEEGIASLGDNPERKAARRSVLVDCSRRGAWPDLRTVFEQQTIRAADSRAYSIAASVTEYLAARGGKASVVRFAGAGRQMGWDAAARAHYGFRSLQELQAGWEAWANQVSQLAANAAPPSRSLSATRRTH